MFYDQSTETVIGNLGWVDQGSIWSFSVNTKTEARIKVDGARYLGLRSGNDGLFRLAHHYASHPAVTIRHSANPGIELAGIRFDGGKPLFFGDAALWDKVDSSVIIQTNNGPELFLIDARAGKAVPLDLSWFNEASYDLGYQGLVDCLTIQERGLVVVAVQRSSELVMIDIETNARIGSFMLAGRGGNPTLVSVSETEFVASDYDTICIIDAKTGSMRHSLPLQRATANTQQFIGDFDIVGRTCAIARPFSGDVVLVDLKNFDIAGNTPVGGQPLAICLLPNSQFLTRDWKTGKVSIGTLPGG